jgi:hypothetical protein
MAASDKMFAASVPPTPPTSDTSSGIRPWIPSATLSENPYAAAGIPLAIGFPIVRRSGSSPYARV